MKFNIHRLFALLAGFLIACGGPSRENNSKENAQEEYQPSTTTPAAAIDSSKHPELSDPVENQRGIGKFTQVELGASLDKKMAASGKELYDVKCYSCHKLNDERLVGPGWKGVTQRRAPEWIMNFSTNTDEMLNKDAQAQAMLEICLIRMPNQNLTDQEARDILEFMRENDGVN